MSTQMIIGRAIGAAALLVFAVSLWWLLRRSRQDQDEGEWVERIATGGLLREGKIRKGGINHGPPSHRPPPAPKTTAGKIAGENPDEPPGQRPGRPKTPPEIRALGRCHRCRGRLGLRYWQERNTGEIICADCGDLVTEGSWSEMARARGQVRLSIRVDTGKLEIGDLKARLALRDFSIKMLEREVENLKIEITHLQDDLHLRDISVRVLDGQLDQARKDRELIQETNRRLAVQLENSESANRHLKQDLEEAEAHLVCLREDRDRWMDQSRHHMREEDIALKKCVLLAAQLEKAEKRISEETGLRRACEDMLSRHAGQISVEVLQAMKENERLQEANRKLAADLKIAQGRNRVLSAKAGTGEQP